MHPDLAALALASFEFQREKEIFYIGCWVGCVLAVAPTLFRRNPDPLSRQDRNLAPNLNCLSVSDLDFDSRRLLIRENAQLTSGTCDENIIGRSGFIWTGEDRKGGEDGEGSAPKWPFL